VSSGLAFSRVFYQWKIEHQVSAVLFSFFLATLGADRGGKEAMSSQISSMFCHFVLWQAASPTKYCWSFEVKVLGFPKRIWLGCATACNYFRTDDLNLSRQPCSSVSKLLHSLHFPTWCSIFHWQIARNMSTQDRQTLQNSDEKQHCHSYIA